MSEPVARTPEEWFAILRGEVNELGNALGQAIRTLSGDALFAHEEAVRALTVGVPAPPTIDGSQRMLIPNEPSEYRAQIWLPPPTNLSCRSNAQRRAASARSALKNPLRTWRITPARAMPNCSLPLSIPASHTTSSEPASSCLRISSAMNALVT